MMSRSFVTSRVVLCLIAGISITSGSWYSEEDWGLKYPERTTFGCPSSLPITSVYSEFNPNTSQREWKFSCQGNGINNLNFDKSWSYYVNDFQKDFAFSCAQFDGSHFIFGIDVLYDQRYADGRWRFGCGKVQPGYRLDNCSTIPVSLSIGKLQEIFEYTATDNTTFVAGFVSEFDVGLKDRMWGLAHCKLATVHCEKPPQPEGVIVAYDSLQYGSIIKYKCQNNYTYVRERIGMCNNSGLWTISPPDCQLCVEMPYCQNVLCVSHNLSNVLCLKCQNFTNDGLQLTRNQFKCEAGPVITNSLPKQIAFDDYDTVTLNCNATGFPKPKVVWHHNSSVVSQTERVRLLPNGSLVILTAILSDVGLYECTASSNDHQVSISVELRQRKFEPPVIVDWTNTMYLPIKQPAVLHCKAVGHPQPKIIWYKDGVLVQHRGRFKISTNGTLLITKVKKKDAGRYRCKALNEIDWIAREVLIHVYKKVDTKIPEDPTEEFAPIIKPWKLVVTASLNTQLVLTCQSFGNPKPDIKWFKTTRYGDKLIKGNRRTSVHPNGVLAIENVDYGDNGQYSCQASNPLGTVEKHLLVMVKSTTSVSTTPITTTTVATTTVTTATTEAVTPNTTSTSISISTSLSETPTPEVVVPTNSTIAVTGPHPLTTDSHAATLKIHWLLVYTLSAYTLLSVL